MHKVPVGNSIARAYEFILQDLTTVIGTAWLPALLFATGFFLFFEHMHDWMPAERQDLAAVVLTIWTFVGAWAFTLMICAIIGVSLTQEALGVRKDFTLAHLVIGPRELRLFFSYVRFYIVLLLLYVAVLAVSVGAMYAAQHYGAALAPAIRPGGFSVAVLGAALLTVVLFVWYLLSMLRLFFLLAAVASAEPHARLSRVWALTRGSDLRILGVYLGTLLPLALAAAVALYFVIGPDQWAHASMALQAQKPGAPYALEPFYAANAFVFAAAAGLLALVGGALLAGAAAYAYRAVTGQALPEREDDTLQIEATLEPEAPPAVAAAPVAVAAPAIEDLPAPPAHDHNGDHGLVDAPHDNHHHDNHTEGHSHGGGEGHAVHTHGEPEAEHHAHSAPVEHETADHTEPEVVEGEVVEDHPHHGDGHHGEHVAHHDHGEHHAEGDHDGHGDNGDHNGDHHHKHDEDREAA
jgi:hypothetical protein